MPKATETEVMIAGSIFSVIGEALIIQRTRIPLVETEESRLKDAAIGVFGEILESVINVPYDVQWKDRLASR